MPEGPTLLILKESVDSFKGRKIKNVSGNTKTDKERLLNQTIIDFKTWGKHFLICFQDFTVKIHLMMFGSYLINEKKSIPERLHLGFENGELNFYNCSVKIREGFVDTLYDFTSDVLHEEWDPAKARKKLKDVSNEMVCDVLLDQDIFSGVGNIIKNEVLYRIRVHPESMLGKLSEEKRNELIAEARNYSFDFLRWKRKYELKKHWLVYGKRFCSTCNQPITRQHTGRRKRLSYFCENCQISY